MEKHPRLIEPSDIATIISRRLGISFLCDFDQQMEPQGNVCFAQSPELRTDYRESFTLADLTAYIYGLSYSPTKRNLYPTDALTFWELVKIGNEYPCNFKKENVSFPVSIELHPTLKHNKVAQIEIDDTGTLWINDL